jgi:hypothetical protein
MKNDFESYLIVLSPNQRVSAFHVEVGASLAPLHRFVALFCGAIFLAGIHVSVWFQFFLERDFQVKGRERGRVR